MLAGRWNDCNLFSYCNHGSVGLSWLIVGRGSGLLLIVPGGARMEFLDGCWYWLLLGWCVLVVLLAGWIVVGSILLVLGGL